MTERETLLAEIAEKQARLAKLDAEPDYEAWRPALEAYYTSLWGQPPTLLNFPSDWAKGVIRGLAAALPKAPPMGSVMGEAEIEALARQCLGGVLCAGELFTSDGHFKVNEEKALANLSETLSCVQPRWPSEAELREMADVSSQSKYFPYAVALEMARRIRAYQTEEQP
jgi:hypothetical protein